MIFVFETKIDSSFPEQQFNIPKYPIFQKDCNSNGTGLIFCVNQDLSYNVLNPNKAGLFEGSSFWEKGLRFVNLISSLHILRRTNLISIELCTAVKQAI